MKVEFLDQEHFNIYYFYEEELKTVEELKIFFKMINQQLQKFYDYEFEGFYEVDVYVCEKLFIMKFKNLDHFGKADFDITFILNSVLLYEFEDSDFILGEKIYYQKKFYVELEKMVDDIHLFEYGNVVFGDDVNNILNQGILISI